jgi:hypothetical protein
MILRNENYSYTAKYENATAEPLYNTNKAVTIGGRVKSQTDSKRLKITSTIRIPQSELASIELITDDFTLPMYYTPNCPLYNRTTAEEMEVIMNSAPRVEQRIYYGDKVFYITYDFEEVLSG